jgi:hypothetical protein
VKTWCFPKENNPEFAWRMEDVLSVYELPYDPAFPQVCMDEASKQLIGEVAPPTGAEVGKPRREDYEYVRNGTSNQFMFCEPLRGWRHVEVTDRRTMQDWARAIQRLVDVHYPEAERIRLVLDNLNTHTGAKLVRHISAGRGEADTGSTRNPLHAQTRQLAQHGRDRNRHHEPPMPESPHR